MERKAMHDLQDCAITINNWMNGNKPKMNNSKTEFIMFGSRKQLDKCATESIVSIMMQFQNKSVYAILVPF